MRLMASRIAYILTVLGLAIVTLAGAVFFILEVHTLTIDNHANRALENVRVRMSGKLVWQGDIPPGSRKWIFGTQPDAVISDADRKLTVSMTLGGRNSGHDFGYIVAAESHYLGVTGPESLRAETFCRCFF